jgi:hypothetical protein
MINADRPTAHANQVRKLSPITNIKMFLPIATNIYALIELFFARKTFLARLEQLKLPSRLRATSPQTVALKFFTRPSPLCPNICVHDINLASTTLAQEDADYIVRERRVAK